MALVARDGPVIVPHEGLGARVAGLAGDTDGGNRSP